MDFLITPATLRAAQTHASAQGRLSVAPAAESLDGRASAGIRAGERGNGSGSMMAAASREMDAPPSAVGSHHFFFGAAGSGKQGGACASGGGAAAASLGALGSRSASRLSTATDGSGTARQRARESDLSPETRHLLKSLMRTSKLTYSQQRFLDGLVSGIRTLDQIKQAGMYEPDVFRTTPMKDMQAEKERFQDRLEGIERPKDSLKAFGRRRGLRSKEVDAMPAIAEEPAVDEFEMVQQEIQERRQWLDDMIALGRGDKYKRQIQGEIAQVGPAKLHWLEVRAGLEA
ncbi:hypothetical protein HK105_206855 [Polyrhizophydium stewartii]|uniref:Uncharacterized protein n=1 Tax=Polyrhizophydium stewartii TaxID=2732419 RepID=A0ABR4N2F6_9FUNG